MDSEEKKVADAEKIPQFLIWDFIDNLDRINHNNLTKSVIQDSFKATWRRYKKYKVILDLMDNICNKFLSGKSTQKINGKTKKIIFDTSVKYLPVITEAKKNVSVEMTVKGQQDRLFAIKNFIRYASYSDLTQFICGYLSQNDEQFLYRLLGGVKEKIKKTNPDYVVLWNDSLPIERAIVLVCRELGIPTIDIQHGIYNLKDPLFDGATADYVFVWGRYFKDMYIKKGIRKADSIYILGYPYIIESVKSAGKKDKKISVCYLGQDYELYDEKLLSIKIETIRSLEKTCGKLGMKLTYRPHPGDDLKMLKTKLPGVNFSSRNEKLSEAFKKGDIFISYNSTALMEASMRSKISLQLMNYPLGADNYEELGVCSKALKTIEELENYLVKISDSKNLDEFKPKFNNNFMDISGNPRRRFMEILNELDKKRQERK